MYEFSRVVIVLMGSQQVFLYRWTMLVCLNLCLIVTFIWCTLIISVPFEEDEKDPSIWFLDHNYHESMFSMFKRINGIFSCSSAFCAFYLVRIVCLY